MTQGDRLMIVAVALLAVLAWPVTYLAASGRSDVVVVTGPHGRSEIPLEGPSTVDVEGAGGPVTVVIQDGEVRVAASTCPDKLCVRQGVISGPGEAIVCVPNGVTVRVGGGGDALDSVVR